MKFISLSSDKAGYSCGVSQFCRKYFSCNDYDSHNFFDFLIVSMSSINTFLINKEPLEADIKEKNGFGNYNVNFLHYDLLQSIHDLKNKEDINQFLQKFNRKRDRFFNLLNSLDTILFFRFSITDESSEINIFIKNIEILYPLLKYKLIIMHEKEIDKINDCHLLYHRFEQLSMHNIDNFIRLKNQYDPSEIQISLKKEFPIITKFVRPKNKNAIVVLTKGYNDQSMYNKLIERNKNINKKMDNPLNADMLIFHEGNISVRDQHYIKSFTPNLFLQFISVKERAFLKKNEDISFHPDTINPLWRIGYRHMCHFWFVDFWHYVDGYENILRIDEDVKIDFNIEKVFNSLKLKTIVAGKWTEDDPCVTINLINNCNDYYQKNNIVISNKYHRRPYGPYSNVMGLNLYKLSMNQSIKKFIDYIDKSQNIYHYRWGDLPLWGEVALFFIPKDELLIDHSIKYYHDSLKDFVNNEKTYEDKLNNLINILHYQKRRTIRRKI